MSGRAKRWFVNSVILFVSCTVSLAAAEMLSRAVKPVGRLSFTDMQGNPINIVIPDDDLRGRLRPDLKYRQKSGEFDIVITTNGQGFRGDRLFQPPGPDVFRIMVLGDSFTFGIGVPFENTYSEQLGKLLRENGAKNIEILNLGVPGYTTAQELLLFEKFKHLDPDLIIVGFLARDQFVAPGGNDVVENYFFARWQKTGFSANKLQKLPLTRRVRFFLLLNSNLYRLADKPLSSLYHQIRGSFADTQQNPDLESAWEITETELLKFDEELEELGIPGILLHIPFPKDDISERKRVHERIKRLELRRLALVDSVEFMEEGWEKYHFEYDFHWNSLGHEKAAVALFEAIKKAGIIP